MITSQAYPWTDNGDEVAFDAVTVQIDSDQVEFAWLGLPFGEPAASVMWPTVDYGGGESMQASQEAPFTVPEALARAHELALATGLDRPLIASAAAVSEDLVGHFLPRYPYALGRDSDGT